MSTLTDRFRRPHSRARMVEIDETGIPLVLDAEIDQRLVIDEMNTCVRRVIDSLPEDYRTAWCSTTSRSKPPRR